MGGYYDIIDGDLYPGHIAKSSDIIDNLQAIKDAIRNAVRDLTEGQSWILGRGDTSDKNAFVLTPETKRAGRYIDQMNLAEGDDVELVSIRETSYRQPIKLSRSSLYSVIVKMQNKSEKPVPVTFELRDGNGELIPNMKTILTLPKETHTPAEYEIIFDLDYYPTAHGIEPEDLEQDNPQLVNPNTDEESYQNGVDYEDEDTLTSSTAGASVVYLFIEALNRNKQQAFDVNTQQKNGYTWNDTDPTFGIVINKNSSYGSLLEEDSGSGFTASSTPGVLYFKEIYANAPTYKCELGEAIIDGEKVMLADTHVSIGGANSEGDVISYIYMDINGHLNAMNSEPFIGSEPATPIEVTEPHLHIANIITYMNDVKDPVIEQSDETQITRPRSHHERIRRLEKKTEFLKDISIPPRFKYVLTGEDWIDPNPNTDLVMKSYNGYKARNIDALDKEGYVVTTDANGNFVIKISESKSFNIPITLKDQTSGKITTEKNKNKIIKEGISANKAVAESDIKQAQRFAEIKNMKNNITTGKLTLEDNQSGIIVATNKKEAKETEFNPWDDSKSNRPSSANMKPTTRHYTVTSGKNGANDWASEFPAMTFFTNNGYKLKKLQIPIYKFKNCTGIKFIIWKRQGPNNKKNTVWLKEKIYTSDTFSLDKAKVKKGYQYVEDGFLINFGKNGLDLPAGQYVIVCLPIVKSGKGTVYVDTYKPKNSKDFCIRYYGAANASHFLLKDRYQEIWYNPAKAQVEETTYSKTGSLTSGTVNFGGNIEHIKSVKATGNLTTPPGTKVNLYVDIGGGWEKIKIGEEKTLTGSGSGESFRWKIEFKGNAKKTPVLKYNKKKGYALNFEITRAEPSTSSLAAFRTLNNNLCLTSVLFDANNILREYLGDMNWALTDNKFSNYEFVRIWGTDSENQAMKIDLLASDRLDEVKVKDGNGNSVPYLDPSTQQKLYYPVYSFYYCDIKLADIPNISVDYSNYDPTLEEDEHNLRMKLDTDNSYNDEDIHIVGYNNFKLANQSYAVTEETSDSSETTSNTKNGLTIDLSKIIASENNQLLAKAKFLNTLDLTKYSGIKLGFTLDGIVGGTVSGLGLYISSQNEEDVPTDKINEEYLDAIKDGLPDLNSSTEDIIADYANQIVVDTVDYNGTAVKVYYQSVWNSAEQIWEWQQIHDVKSYNIYELIDRSSKSNTLTITDSNNGKLQYYEIEIDPNNVNLQYAKEMGLIVLNDEEKYSNTNVSSITISDFKAFKNDYYNVFNASENNVFVSKIPDTRAEAVTTKQNGQLGLKYDASNTYNSTVPPTSSVTIKYQAKNSSNNYYNLIDSSGEDLCSFDMTSKSTKGFNYIGIQLATDCLITKNMLALDLRKVDKDKNETTIETINLPTMNHIYYVTDSKNNINLSQIFKKIKTTEKFDKIVLRATNKFTTYMKQLKTSEDGTNLGDTLSLYIGNIALYRANSLPLVHPYFKLKFYLDGADSISRDQIGIRKLGAIIQYQ